MTHNAWPIDIDVLAPFLLAVALIELTPGPNMGWLAMLSLMRGRMAGAAAVAGVTLGLAIWMVASAFGLTEALVIWPWLYQLVRWSGVAFLLWLAWDAWKGSASTANPVAETNAVASGLGQAFGRGLVGNLLNPKAAVFYVALLPTFIRPDHASPLVQALGLGTLHLLVAAAVHGLIVVGAAGAGARMLTDVQAPWVRATAALGLLAVALWMAWETQA